VPWGIVMLPAKRLQSPFKRTVRLHGLYQSSSVTLEHDFWEQLKLIAFERQTTLTALLTEINRKGRLLPFQGHGRHRVMTLSAAIRLFVLQELLAKIASLSERASPHSEAERRSYRKDLDQERSPALSAWKPAMPCANTAHEHARLPRLPEDRQVPNARDRGKAPVATLPKAHTGPRPNCGAANAVSTP
jgi:predicted DNA-binding ribbon-helix-helix protein